MLECIVVGIGGFIGAVCRYLIGLLPVSESCLFPVKTFLVNIAGCFVIGVITSAILKSASPHPRLVLFCKVGLCGGFTTFSSFALETETLLKNGNIKTALAYSLLSIAIGLAAVFAGEAAVR